MRRVTLLEVRDPEVLTDLTRAHRVRQSLGRTLSPRAIVVREPRVPALLRQLAKRGLIPRTNLPADQLSHHRTTQLSPYRTSELSDYDTPVLAQLYYAARLNHELSDRLPAAYRLPYSIVLDLEAQITPHDRDLASELAREAAQILLKKEYRSQNTASPINRADSEFYILNSELQSTLAAIERAIQTNTPLTLTYYAATYDQVTTRVVEPLRLEWRYDIPYLIAYCRTRQDERTFRVDRIMEISEQAIP